MTQPSTLPNAKLYLEPARLLMWKATTYAFTFFYLRVAKSKMVLEKMGRYSSIGCMYPSGVEMKV